MENVMNLKDIFTIDKKGIKMLTILMSVICLQFVLIIALLSAGVFYGYKSYRYSIGTFYLQRIVANKFDAEENYNVSYEEENSKDKLLEKSRIAQPDLNFATKNIISLLDMASKMFTVYHKTEIVVDGKTQVISEPKSSILSSMILDIKHNLDRTNLTYLVVFNVISEETNKVIVYQNYIRYLNYRKMLEEKEKEDQETLHVSES